ncbi:MAG: hypothetical protein Q8Q50_12895, partial [Methylobacter sp.]|nr:hypothetical protein [Methylobacter sp.]
PVFRGVSGHVGVYLMGFATFGANPIKNSRNPIDTATILFNFWETSAIYGCLCQTPPLPICNGGQNSAAHSDCSIKSGQNSFEALQHISFPSSNLGTHTFKLCLMLSTQQAELEGSRVGRNKPVRAVARTRVSEKFGGVLSLTRVIHHTRGDMIRKNSRAHNPRS